MARPKKIIEAELIEPENETPAGNKPATKMVDAEHTIKYREPVPVPILEESDEDESYIYDDDDEENRPKRLKKSIREKLQEKLKKGGITNTDGVYLRIDRFLGSDSSGNDGMNADKEFCWRGPCSIEYITNDDYLSDTAKRHGAGNYWFTLRNQKSILAQWQFKIGGIPQVATATPDPMTGQPQIIYQPVPNQPAAQNQPIDPLKFIRQSFAVVKEYQEVLGVHPQTQYQQPQPPAEPQLSPKVALLSAMAEHPEIVESITDKLLGGNRGDKPPSLTELLIRHGGELFKGAKDFFVGVIQTASTEVKQIKMLDAQLIAQTNGANHLNPEMASPTLPNQTNQSNQIPSAQIQQEGTTGYQQNESRKLDSQPGQTAQETISDPKEILISIALNGCKNQTPPKVVANQLIAFADRIEDEAPHMSVYGWLDLFTEYEPDQIINFMQSGAMGDEATFVAELAHSHRWVGELRSLLKTEIEEETNE